MADAAKSPMFSSRVTGSSSSTSSGRSDLQSWTNLTELRYIRTVQARGASACLCPCLARRSGDADHSIPFALRCEARTRLLTRTEDFQSDERYDPSRGRLVSDLF